MKKIIRSVFIISFTLLCLCPTFITVYAKGAPVSPALSVIAEELNMTKTCLKDNTANFSSDDFENALGIKKVNSIKIVKVPPATLGKLMLGSLEVVKNQTISRRNLKYLKFVPNGSETLETSFEFIANGNTDYVIECSLYVISELNFAPTVSIVNERYLNVSTQKNISYYGTLKALDPENDQLNYKIVKEPKNGLLILTDKKSGSYCYTPTKNFVGNDSFSYVVYDKYGNRSEETSVNVKVSKAVSSVVYSDMLGHWAHNAAIKLSSGDIMSGQLVGNDYIFDPNKTVTREEFVCLAIKAKGIKTDKTVKKTVFLDDDEIDPEYKPYIAAAYNQGIIKGSVTEKGIMFYPKSVITRAEAAVILNNIIGAEQPTVKPVFADSISVPKWAESALYALNEIGVFTGSGGNISPFTTLNRAMTAQILCSVMEL